MAERYISDDGRSVVVVHDNGSEDQLSIEEFEATYGFNPLEEEGSFQDKELEFEEDDKSNLSPEELYWDLFDDLCETTGSIMSWRAIIANAENGVFPAQEVVHNCFGHDVINVDQAIACAQAHARKVLRDFEQVGISLGLKPISEHGKHEIKRFLAIRERRQYVRDWGRKYAERGEIVDIGELMRQSYRRQKSLWPESWKRDGCPF